MISKLKNSPDLASHLINGVLAIKPLANLAKHQARQSMIKRSEKLGVPWTKEVQALQARKWETDLAKIQNPQLSYPDYYLRPFHGYETGNLSWQAAFEVEPASYAVLSKVWQDTPELEGDTKVRAAYNEILKAQFTHEPEDILDLGCSVGLSTFSLQTVYPHANITGLDLSPYFLAVAQYRSQQRQVKINWVHAAAEATGLPDASFDLISVSMMCHELPQLTTLKTFAEARRILRPGGYLAIMDMNPESEFYQKIPPFLFTLLKSTEPYLDEYFRLGVEQALLEVGFYLVTIACNSPRHCTVIAQRSN